MAITARSSNLSEHLSGNSVSDVQKNFHSIAQQLLTALPTCSPIFSTRVRCEFSLHLSETFNRFRDAVILFKNIVAYHTVNGKPRELELVIYINV